MRYENETLGVVFTLPDTFTVRQQLAYRSKIAQAADESAFVRVWLGAVSVMQDWQCEHVPDPAALDLDATDDRKTADIVQWTANTVAGHMADLETPPKK